MIFKILIISEAIHIQVDIYGVPDNNSIVCVRWEEEGKVSFHIIRVDYSSQTPELKCVTCKTGNCAHCKEVLKQDVNASDLPVEILKAFNETVNWRFLSDYGTQI